jgi:hypothetical protein
MSTDIRIAKERFPTQATIVAFALAVSACGESSKPQSDAGVMPDVNLNTCGAIGAACGVGCADGFECITNACAPVRGDCGGFAGAECQDTSLVCTYPTGSSGGICMRDDEKACLCAIAPNAVQDCLQP